MSKRRLSFDDAVKQYIDSTHAGFDHDRSLTIGASEIEKCARAVAYKKGGVGQDDGYVENPGYAHRGNVMEDHWFVPLARHWFKSMGSKLHHAGQQDQMSIVAEDVFASATPDGIASNVPDDALRFIKGSETFKGGDLLNEFKSIDPNVNVARLPRPWHAGQVNYGLGLVRAATKFKPTHGLLWYGNCSDYSKIKHFVIPFHKGKFREQLKRAAFIMAARKKPDQLAPEGKINGGKECETCPFSKRCLGFSAWVPKGERALKSRDRSRVAKLVEKIDESKKLIAAAEQSKRSTEADLKAALTELGTNSAEIGQTKIQWSRTEGSERLDQAKMLKVLLRDGYKRKDFVTKTKPSDRLDIN